MSEGADGVHVGLTRHVAGKIASSIPLHDFVEMHAAGRIEDMAKAGGPITGCPNAVRVQTASDAGEQSATFLERRLRVYH